MITSNLSKLVLQQSALVTGLSAQAIQMILRLWSPFRDWYDDDLILAYAARSATTIESAQRAARRRERAFQKFVFSEMGIEFPTNAQIDQVHIDLGTIEGGVDVYPRDGVSPLDVWVRPAEQYRYNVSKGIRENASLIKALKRAEQIAHTDISLARREELRAIYVAAPKIEGYRRVIHPELSDDGTSCGLCVVASNRVYKSDQLLPIHDGCNCTALPVTRDNDPGKDINQEDLQAIYDAAGSNAAADLLKTRVKFDMHGELGPILRSAGKAGVDGFETQAKRQKAKKMSPLENVKKQLEVMRASMQRLIERKQRGETGLDTAIAWQRDRVSVLTRQVNTLERILG